MQRYHIECSRCDYQGFPAWLGEVGDSLAYCPRCKHSNEPYPVGGFPDRGP